LDPAAHRSFSKPTTYFNVIATDRGVNAKQAIQVNQLNRKHFSCDVGDVFSRITNIGRCIACAFNARLHIGLARIEQRGPVRRYGVI
jgi:hypothetical protein